MARRRKSAVDFVRDAEWFESANEDGSVGWNAGQLSFERFEVELDVVEDFRASRVK